MRTQQAGSGIGTLLSTDSPTKDEDPSVILARDGKLYVAWFSDRGGNADIYIASTQDGAEWSAPVRVTTNSGGDFAPSLYQDGEGTFHLVWFRWENRPFNGHIWYNSSPDGRTWDAGNEEQVTRAWDVDDWVPTLTQAADGTLLVYFVSEKRGETNPTNDIYLATKPPNQTDWMPVMPVPDINSASEHDHLPFAARTGDVITLLWVRYDTSEPLPWLNKKSDVFMSTSLDGFDWSAPVQITREEGNVVNLFPALYESHAGEWFILWLSTRLGAPRLFELPLGNASPYPETIIENTWLGAGYSHRIAATTDAGIYLGAWVQGEEGEQDVYYRVFEK